MSLFYFIGVDMFKQYENLEKELKMKNYIFLGWENGWGGKIINNVYYQNNPDIVIKCKEKNHVIKDVQMNQRGSENIKYCYICKYYSKYDCSD
jgi:hypothetical protein